MVYYNLVTGYHDLFHIKLPYELEKRAACYLEDV